MAVAKEVVRVEAEKGAAARAAARAAAMVVAMERGKRSQRKTHRFLECEA